MDKKKAALTIINRLCKAGFIAYFAGGCVRDELTQREPSDYDIVTNAAVSDIETLFERTVTVGARFGVTLVVIDGEPFEVAMFRREGPYLDGRRPSTVAAATPREDALRRDFTVNGLFYDPASEEIIDYVNGQKDIEQKIIRAIGDAHQRFNEDKLRLLRAIRFACVLDFTIEKNTWAAITSCAGMIISVSAERIREELIKIITSPGVVRGLELLDASGILAIILPEVAAMKGVEQPPEFHPEGDVFTHTKLMLGMLESPSPVLAMACLLHDSGKPATYEERDRIRFNEHDKMGAALTETICRRLKFSNDETRAIVDCVAGHMRFMHAKDMRSKRLEKLFGRETFADEMELHRVDCKSSHGDLSIWEFLTKEYAAFLAREPDLEPLLMGADLLLMGYTPGVRMGEILHAVEEARLDGVLSDKDEALAWVKEQFPRI